jgi:quercetin dioxygenase-like cupin family protein
MAGVIRIAEIPAVVAPGPFEHIDVRWFVGVEANGARQVSVGQSTYPAGVTHEPHYHPNAEEVVVVTAGRAKQVIGDETLELGPGEACFIPTGVPHRITAVSDEELVILWILSAPSMEAAGYVAFPA